MNNNSSSTINFKSASHVYFYTSDGKRILDDKNVRKCERYLVNQLNNATKLNKVNENLFDTFKKGDKDYQKYSIARSFYEYSKNKAKNIVAIITGNHVTAINYYAKKIGQAKKASGYRKGTLNSYETIQAVKKYNEESTKILNENGIYKDGKRQAFGVIFEPKYQKDGELKELKYVRSAWFDENKVKK